MTGQRTVLNWVIRTPCSEQGEERTLCSLRLAQAWNFASKGKVVEDESKRKGQIK